MTTPNNTTAHPKSQHRTQQHHSTPQKPMMADTEPPSAAKAAEEDVGAEDNNAAEEEEDTNDNKDTDTKMEESPPEKENNETNNDSAVPSTQTSNAHNNVDAAPETTAYPKELPADFAPAADDVVLGWDKPGERPGRTTQFLGLVRSSMMEYSQTTTSNKQARMLILKLAKKRASQEYGRFLRFQPKTARYTEIGVAQAMRECVKAHHHQQQRQGHQHNRSNGSLTESLHGSLSSANTHEQKHARERHPPPASKTIQQVLPPDYRPRQIDVIFGRGGGVNQHPGNQFYRNVLQQQQPQYATSQKLEKVRVARFVLQQVHDRGGMFVQNLSGKGWCQVQDSVALSKIAQGFRDCKKQDEPGAMASPVPALATKPTPSWEGSQRCLLSSYPAPPMAQISHVPQPQDTLALPVQQMATTAPTQDPAALQTLLSSLYPTQAQLDHDIRQLQSLVWNAQTSQDLALLQAAVRAQDRLPLLQQLAKSGDRRALQELQQEREELQQKLQFSAVQVPPKKRLALAKRLSDLTQQCQLEEQALAHIQLLTAASPPAPVLPAAPVVALTAAGVPTAAMTTPVFRRRPQPLMMSSFSAIGCPDAEPDANALVVPVVETSSCDNSERDPAIAQIRTSFFPAEEEEPREMQAGEEEEERELANEMDDDSSSGSSSSSSITQICAV